MKKRNDFFLLYLFIYSLGDFCVLNYLPINQTGDKMCNKPRELGPMELVGVELVLLHVLMHVRIEKI